MPYENRMLFRARSLMVFSLLYDAKLAAEFASELLKLGVYVIAFSFPVVPREKARIRTQMSAALSCNELDYAIDAFKRAHNKLGI